MQQAARGKGGQYRRDGDPHRPSGRGFRPGRAGAIRAIRDRRRRLIEGLDVAADETVEQRAQTLLCGLAPAQGIEFSLEVFEGLTPALSVLHYTHGKQGSYILAAEWCGIWAFAIYWFVKNYELTQVAKVLKSKKLPMQQKNIDELADKL